MVKDSHSSVETVPEKKCHDTQLTCIWLDGSYCKPWILYTKNHPIQSNFEEYINALFVNTVSSWANKEMFLWWVNCFLVEVQRRRQIYDNDANTTYYLLLDKHASRKNEEALNILKLNNITPIFFVPHNAHKAQPLDKTVHTKIKHNYTKIWNNRRTIWPNLREHKCHILTAARAAYYLKPFNVLSSFKTTGIFPSRVGPYWVAKIDKSAFVSHSAQSSSSPDEALDVQNT